MSEEEYLRRKFKLKMGDDLNLENPRSFNEKIQWLKLYDRKAQYTIMADKMMARNYVVKKITECGEIIGIIPILGCWKSEEEIDFDKLLDKFVLKCNHNSGEGLCICGDKSKLNIVKEELRNALRRNYYLLGREWPYKNIKRLCIAEKYIEQVDGG